MSKDYSKMSVARLTQEYEETLREQIVKAIDNVPSYVHALVKDAVGKVIESKLGLTYSHGRWDLSYTQNEGEFSRLVRNTANEYVRENAEKLTKTFLSKLTKDDTDEIKDTYKATLADAIDRLMAERAAVESAAIVAKVLGKKGEEA